jgi:YHS domain-containing protein
MKRSVLLIALITVNISLLAQRAEIFQTDQGAIRGFDAVAFFTAGKAIEGNKQFVYEWKGAKWYFSCQQNLDAFKENPEKFAPQYGGYCAYGTADGHKAPTETDTWTIINDKLYFNYNKKVQTEWKKDPEALIRKANENWPRIKDKE